MRRLPESLREIMGTCLRPKALLFSYIRLFILALTVMISTSCQATETPASPTIPPEILDEDVSVQALHGAYINAGNSTPLVLIVPGSGPTDRDGNAPEMKSDMYKLLARELAVRGVSSVRIDKRGMYSSAAAGNPNDVTLGLYAGDYRLWIDYLTKKTGQDCIYLLGHSEGALMVTAAAIDRSDVCGLILASGPGRPLGDVLREQIKANPANKLIEKKAFEAISALEAGDSVDVSKMHPALQGLFAPAVQEFLKSLFPVDPVDMLTRAGTRTLILQGDNDLQVSLQDAKRLNTVAGTELVILKDVNHVLKKASRSRRRNFAVYNMPDRPVDETLVNAVVGFVKAP